MKSYSQDLRDKVINCYEKHSYNVRQLSELFNISIPTVRTWIKRYVSTGDYSSKQGVGCGRTPSFNDKTKILNFLTENPDANAIEIRDFLCPEIPMSTFYDTLKRMGITYKKKSPSTKNAKQVIEKRT